MALPGLIWTYMGEIWDISCIVRYCIITPDILAIHFQIQPRLLWVLYAHQYWCHWSESLSIVLYMNDKGTTFSLPLALSGYKRPKAQFSILQTHGFSILPTCLEWHLLLIYIFVFGEQMHRFSVTRWVRGTQKIREIIIPKENVSPTEDTVYKVICEATMLWLNKTYKHFLKKKKKT